MLSWPQPEHRTSAPRPTIRRACHEDWRRPDFSPFSTSSLLAASTCSVANVSPLLHPLHSCPPRNDCLESRNRPPSRALLPVRTQSSRPTSRNTLIGWTAHHAKSLTDFSIGENIQKGRLPELHRQRLLQCIIKHRFAGLVVKVRKDNGVLLGERRRLAGRERKP